MAALREGGCGLAGHCLDGPSLVQQAHAGAADVVLAAASLHRLTAESLTAVREAGVPVVLLATAADACDGVAYVLPEASNEAAVVAALGEAKRRCAMIDPAASTGPGGGDPRRPQGDGEVIRSSVAKEHRAPRRSPLVSRRLGQASAAFTMDTYAHLLKGQQKVAAEALDHLLGP